jgi:hypothetical protein
MLADPQSVTISGVATSLPRTASGTNSGAFSSSDGAIKFSAQHAYGRRVRRVIRLDHTKIAPDPITAVNTKVSMSTYLVADVPANTAYTVAEAKAIIDGFTTALNASSGALVTKLLGGES